MYSVVLMAALTTGASTPDCWFKCGCYGGCYGCYGCYGGWGCYGCYGCWGGYGCYGCWGGYGCYGGYAPLYMMPAAPSGGTTPEPAPAPKPEKTGALPTKARLVVELPADAKLFIDDQQMKTTSARRVFNTPTLEPGQSYYYILRAEIVRDGKTYTDTKQVVVRAGAEVQASFNNLELAAASEKAVATARR